MKTGRTQGEKRKEAFKINKKLGDAFSGLVFFLFLLRISFHSNNQIKITSTAEHGVVSNCRTCLLIIVTIFFAPFAFSHGSYDSVNPCSHRQAKSPFSGYTLYDACLIATSVIIMLKLPQYMSSTHFSQPEGTAKHSLYKPTC